MRGTLDTPSFRGSLGVDVEAPHNEQMSGRRGLALPLLMFGMAAGTFGSAAILLLIALSLAGAHYPAWLAWVTTTGSGFSDGGIPVSAGGATLAACFLGLTLGVTGWIVARRRGASLRAPKLVVLISLIGPFAVVVSWSLGIIVFVISEGTPT